MATFAYKGIDPNGSLVTGRIDAENLDAANTVLAVKHLVILSIRKASEVSARLSSHLNRLAKRDVIELARSLATILRAGISLLDGLDDIGQATENKVLKNTVYDVKDRILSGSTLSEALGANKRVFPDVLVKMVRIGEETGRLELSLTEVADHLQRIEDLSHTVKRALMYPVFALVVITGALAFWLIYVMPKLIAVIAAMGVKLPLSTRVMMEVSYAVRSHWYLLPIIALALFVGIKAAKKNGSVRYYYDLTKMRLPIVRPFVFNRNLAALGEHMSLLVVAGITIDRALTIVGDSMGSEVFKRALYQVKHRILGGSRISEAVKEQSAFPRMVARLIQVGETSGNLGDQFSFISEFYGKKLNEASEKLGKLIEPVMISFVGAVFIIMMIAILVPMYEVIGKLK